ncbi:unnamed protein product, partial [marine sediment metagenome]
LLEATNYSIDIHYEDFLSVMNSKWNAASFEIKVPRTLILVHGFNGFHEQFYKIYRDDEKVKQTYGDRIFKIDYYPYFMGQVINSWSPGIGTIATLLVSYIKSNYLKIRGNIDFVCHSMGGLVVRALIKYHYYKRYHGDLTQFYENKPGQFKIRRVCQLATPNHGILWSTPGQILFSSQITDMAPWSAFLNNLNDPDETPFSEETDMKIEWYTYRGHDDLTAFPICSVPLRGAVNRYFGGLGHDTILTSGWSLFFLFVDLDIPG